jgi:hypothetical protein
MSAPTVPQLQQKLIYANKRVAFAWAKYYEAKNADHYVSVHHYHTLNAQVNDPHIPAHIKATLTEMATELKKKWECPICCDMIPEGKLAITNCGHIYCETCLDTLKAHARAADASPTAKWECAVCRRKHKFSGED